MRCRDYIRLLIEGFSFHTLELKLIFRAGDATFQRIMRHLEQMSSDKEFYELSIYGEGRFFCGHFFEHGIRIYLSRLDERDVIKLVINPRKLIDPKAHYLGIMLCDDRSFDRMEKKFAAIMEKIGLPTNMDDWTLTRMDLCVNLIFDRKKLPCQIIELIRRGPVIKGFHKEDWVTYYSAKPIGENAALKKHSVKFENQSMAFVAYDKCYQMKQEDLPLPKEMRPRGILRLELQCKKDWIKKEAVKHGYTKTTEKIRFLAQNSRHYLRTYARKLLPAGEYCQPKVIKEKIKNAKNIRKKTKKRMEKFVNSLDNSNVSFEKAVRKMGTDLSVKKVRTLLESFSALGICPVPLTSKCKLKTITSIPSILDQIGDDGLDTRLYKKNRKRPKLVLACKTKDEGTDL